MPFAFLSGWFTVCRSAWCLCTGSQTRRAWFTEEAHLQRYSMIRIENIETMTPQQERDFWTLFSSDIARDDGAVAPSSRCWKPGVLQNREHAEGHDREAISRWPPATGDVGQ